MDTVLRRDIVVSFLLGIVIVIAVHQVTGWWLDSQFGVSVMSAVLVGVAMALTVQRGSSALQRVIALWIGVVGGMTGVLIRMGPGTIWPIVLVIGGVMTAAAIALGVAVGNALASIRSKRKKRKL
jgi:hypothetical protein